MKSPKVSQVNQSNDSKILHLHIGIPKTASTWLQTVVFPQIKHLEYLHSPRSNFFKVNNNAEESVRFLEDIFKQSSQIWKGYGDTIFENLLGDRHNWLENNRDLLISEEGIGRTGSRPALLAAHLRELKIKSAEWGFSNLKVIYVIRRQDHWLASHYAQMSNRNRAAGQAGFERFVRGVASPQKSRYGFGMLIDHNVLYDHLIDVIGEENLLILPYEMLKESSEEFLCSLLQKLDVPAKKIKEIYETQSESMANVRSGEKHLTWRLRRKESRAGRMPIIRWFVNNQEQTIRLTPDISQKVLDTYSKGNQVLADKTDLDLLRYGYFDQ